VRVYAVPKEELLGAALEITESIIDALETLCPGAFAAPLPQTPPRKAAKRRLKRLIL